VSRAAAAADGGGTGLKQRGPFAGGAALALAAILGSAAIGAAGCRRTVVSPAPRNVVVVLVDTLRADHLPLYGYRRDTSPHLSALARDGVLFTDVRSQAGCTYPSVDSLLTSRHPYLFLAPGGQGMGIPPGVPALPELLAAKGWDTAAVSASLIVRKSPSRINPTGGFGRGFRAFDERCREDDGRCVNRRALALLAGLREPFFLYLHYLEPHQPYRPPRGERPRFAARTAAWPRWVRRGDPWPIVHGIYRGAGVRSFATEDARHLTDLYDEEIASFDDRLGELLAALDDDGRLDRTVVVVLSDHGEELLDHGHWGHCRSLAFDTLLATPLVLRVPGMRGGLVRHAPVANLDLVPTLLDYVGLPWREEGFDGTSLRPVIERDQAVHRYRFALQGTVRVVDDGRYKLMLDLEGGDVRLFDLRADPGERRDLSRERPDLLATYRRAVERWVAAEEGLGSRAESLRRARESEAQLRAVGYL